MGDRHGARRQQLWRTWPPETPRAHALLVTDPADIFYLAGYRGDAGWLVLTEDRAWLLADGRFWAQAEQECPELELVRVQGVDMTQALAAWVAEQGVASLAFDAAQVSYATATRWSSELADVSLVPTTGLVLALRLIKDDLELEAIRHAAAVTDIALAELLPFIQPGACEATLATELEYRLRRGGSVGLAFAPIVAAGARAALPHARPGPDQVGRDDVVVVDLGARCQEYCADMTRTVLVGHPDAEAAAVFAIVERALAAGLAALRPGVTGQEVDRAARGVIEAAGYGPQFSHGTGHGVGLWIHEPPRLSWSGGGQVIPAGAVVTIEPGIYLPGRFGVRLEELVYIGEQGIEVLSRSPLRLH